MAVLHRAKETEGVVRYTLSIESHPSSVNTFPTILDHTHQFSPRDAIVYTTRGSCTGTNLFVLMLSGAALLERGVFVDGQPVRDVACLYAKVHPEGAVLSEVAWTDGYVEPVPAGLFHEILVLTMEDGSLRYADPTAMQYFPHRFADATRVYTAVPEYIAAAQSTPFFEQLVASPHIRERTGTPLEWSISSVVATTRAAGVPQQGEGLRLQCVEFSKIARARFSLRSDFFARHLEFWSRKVAGR